MRSSWRRLLGHVCILISRRAYVEFSWVVVVRRRLSYGLMALKVTQVINSFCCPFLFGNRPTWIFTSAHMRSFISLTISPEWRAESVWFRVLGTFLICSPLLTDLSWALDGITQDDRSVAMSVVPPLFILFVRFYFLTSVLRIFVVNIWIIFRRLDPTGSGSNKIILCG